MRQHLNPADQKLVHCALYTGGILTIPCRARIYVSQAQWPPLTLVRADLRNGYCRPYTAMHPLALCVVHCDPACMGTKIWLVNWLTVTLWELEPVVTFTSHCRVPASITPSTGPLGISLPAV